MCRKPFRATGARLLCILIGLATLWHALTTLSEAELLYGELSPVRYAPPVVWTLHSVWLASCICLMSGYWTRLGALVALLVYALYREALLQDGGAYVVQASLLYVALLDPKIMRGERAGEWATLIHNLGVAALYTQLCIVYLDAAFWKLSGPSAHNVWLDGSAVKLAVAAPAYGLAWVRSFELPMWLSATLSYGTLAYQLTFSTGIFTRARLGWTLVGVGLHVGIMAAMGLVSFSLTMLGLLALTADDKALKSAFGLLRDFKITRHSQGITARRKV